MCGISGIFRVTGDKPITENLMKAMTETLYHRGPDDQGFYINQNIGLGIQRLSVIDPSGGHQPITNEDGQIRVVCNGEIYNFHELRGLLEQKGHTFRTHSDTEVLVHLYEEEGESFPGKLNGMFGIALWDNRQKKLILARDQAGIKPLYYADLEHSLLFGSELRALMASGEIPREADAKALHYYFSFSYIPEPYSIWRKVKKLEPGHMLVAERNKPLRKTSYFHIELQSIPINRNYCSEKFLEIFSEAVKTQLMSDVPVGTFLSGGLDSAAVTAFYAHHYTGKLKTFSLGFEDTSYNELDYARIVSRKLKTEHHEIVLRANEIQCVPEIISQLDEPFADSSQVPLYFLSRFAAESVKVVLVGDGADVLFGGYETYQANRLASLYRNLPNSMRYLVKGAINMLPVNSKKISLEHKLKRFVEHSNIDPVQSHASWRNIFSFKDQEDLFKPEFYSLIRHFKYWDVYEQHCKEWQGISADKINQFLYLDFKSYLPADMLTKVDRMTMMHSLEARLPFLDRHLVNFAFSIPGSMKLGYVRTKTLLRKALREELPPEIIRRKKTGFNVPLSTWIRGQLKDYFRSSLSKNNLDLLGFIQHKVVLNMLSEQETMKRDHSHRLWALLVLVTWWRRERPDLIV